MPSTGDKPRGFFAVDKTWTLGVPCKDAIPDAHTNSVLLFSLSWTHAGGLCEPPAR